MKMLTMLSDNFFSEKPMLYRKPAYFFLGVLLIFCLIFSAVIFHAQTQKLQVVFLDVGQGDAILISQGNRQILIDGGPSGPKLLEKLGEYVPFWDREIELVLLTHPDADHLSGLVEVLEKYTVFQVIESGAKSTSQVFGAYEKTLEEKRIPKQIARPGMKIKLSADAELEIFGPRAEIVEKVKNNLNETSVVAKLVFGEGSFLFVGDLSASEESRLLAEGLPIGAKVLKVSHHGSKTATGGEFIDRVDPEQAIISVGKSNRYGHPSKEVLEKLRAEGVLILRTDELGDIKYTCAAYQGGCLREMVR